MPSPKKNAVLVLAAGFGLVAVAAPAAGDGPLLPTAENYDAGAGSPA